LKENRRAQLGNEEIDFVLKRNPRSKRMYFYIDDRGLKVSVPLRTSEALLNTELKRHSAWILRKMADWYKHRSDKTIWQHDGVLMYLGKAVLLKLIPRQRDIAPTLVAQELLVPVEDASDELSIQSRVETWYRAQAFAWFQQRATHFAEQLQVQMSKLCLSNARTSWGNCSSDGVVRVTWRLIQAPSHLVDYVLAHEVAHLKEMNHSPRFWGVVRSVYPDYVKARSELNKHYPRYLLI
jgi:predicted metal-dependent hydrolase